MLLRSLSVLVGLGIGMAHASASFSVGETVAASVNLNVRAGPGSRNPSLGVQPTGSRAVVINGVPVDAGGMVWWELKWENGVIGWSAQGDDSESYLTVVGEGVSPIDIEVSDRFVDRWLRAPPSLGSFAGNPLVNGPVAVATMTSGSPGEVGYVQAVFAFDELGRIVSGRYKDIVEPNYEIEIIQELTFGADGLPVRIDVLMTSLLQEVSSEMTDVVTVRWTATSVMTTSAEELLPDNVFTYDVARDVLTLHLDGGVIDYVFQEDDSYSQYNRYEQPDGTWKSDYIGGTSRSAQGSTGPFGTSTIEDSDRYGNPTLISFVPHSRFQGSEPVEPSLTVWEYEYR